MNVTQCQWTRAAGLQPDSAQADASPQLALLFGSRASLMDSASIASIRRRFPNAAFLGCSTAGEILGSTIYDDTVSVTAVHFDATRIVAVSAAIANPADSRAVGATLARSLPADDLVHLFVLSDGLNVNGSEFVKGLSENLPAGVTLSGGLSADGSAFGETTVVFGEAASCRTIAAVGFYGNRLESEAGKGSTFHFTLTFNLQQTRVPETKARDAQMMRLRDMPVLVVDDNAVNRRILEATLRAAFPLVLLDAHMPEMDGFAAAEAIKKDPELAETAVLMLTSGGQRGDAARCRALGIAAYLMKPISQSELLDAILSVVGARPDAPDRLHEVPGHALRESRGTLRILLAEDNKVNQLVAARVLEKRGHTVVIAANGKEALAALDEPGSGGFDLILMDVQMPVMDGFETTGIIRAREKSTGAHLPIIAMTAHAMKGDEERCLAAEMDGYVSKPIQVDQLVAKIDSVLAGVPTPGVTRS
jgi:CheY-like chemotaxis protein